MITADLITITAPVLGCSPGTASAGYCLFAFALAILESAIGAHIDSVGIAAPHQVRFSTSAALPSKQQWQPRGPSESSGYRPWFCSTGRESMASGRLDHPSVMCPVRMFFLTYPADGSGLSTYAHRWRANDGLFALCTRALRLSGQMMDTSFRIHHNPGFRPVTGWWRSPFRWGVARRTYLRLDEGHRWLPPRGEPPYRDVPSPFDTDLLALGNGKPPASLSSCASMVSTLGAPLCHPLSDQLQTVLGLGFHPLVRTCCAFLPAAAGLPAGGHLRSPPGCHGCSMSPSL